MNELDCRILARACGLCWHEPSKATLENNTLICRCIHCGNVFDFADLELGYNPTFDAADDWELVRQKVVVPHLVEFCLYLGGCVGSPPYGYYALSLEWILHQEPIHMIEKCLNFIRSRPDIFPWVVEMEE